MNILTEKEKLIKRLLEAKHITFEEALSLLENNNINSGYWPQTYPIITYPKQPFTAYPEYPLDNVRYSGTSENITQKAFKL